MTGQNYPLAFEIFRDLYSRKFSGTAFYLLYVLLTLEKRSVVRNIRVDMKLTSGYIITTKFLS